MVLHGMTWYYMVLQATYT